MAADVGLAPLAAFSHDWVGGNIAGLAALAGTLYGYTPKMNAVADTLDSQVHGLVGAARWQGAAASSFSAAWGRDSQVARALGLATDQVAGIVDWLAVSLSGLEAELEAAAAEAAAHGVAIGPDGMPPEVCFGPPSNAQQADMQAWANAYQKYYAEVMEQAQQARNTAASALAATGRQIVGVHSTTTGGTASSHGTGHGMDADDDLTVGDLLGDLMAAPAAASRAAAATLKTARASLLSAKAAILKLQSEEAGADTIVPDGMLENLKSSMSSVLTDKDALAAAERSNNVVFETLDTRIGELSSDVSGLLGRLRASSAPTATTPGADSADGADGADGADSVLSKLADFGKDIPVLDVLAATVGTYLGTKDAMADGQPLDEALPEQAGVNVASLGAGALVGGAVAGAVGGTTVVSGLAVGGLAIGGAVAAGTGVLVGGIVAVGVGDFATHLFQENWSGDIHNYGVVLGVEYGVGHSLVETGDDFGHLASDVGHTVSHLWDSMF
jgi:uncharacterized protein YukE